MVAEPELQNTRKTKEIGEQTTVVWQWPSSEDHFCSRRIHSSCVLKKQAAIYYVLIKNTFAYVFLASG